MTGSDIVSLLIGMSFAALALAVLTRTRHRVSVRMMLHWIAGTLGNLFAFQIAALASAWLLWAALHGAPSSVAGLAGLVLTAFAIAGFAFFLQRQFRARAVLDRALRETLGDGAEDSSASRPHWWRLLRPLHFGYGNVEHLRDIAYGPAGIRNQLDIYRPHDAGARDRPLPVLLQVHGSGWMVTSKNMHALPLMHHMASQGWLVVSINYRLSPAARFPAHLIDVKRAIAWIRDNIARYGGDPAFIAITGGSAGAHLATLAALTPNRRDLQPGFETADTSLCAAVPIYGRYDFLDRDHVNEMHAMFVRFATRYIMPGSPQENPEAWELASPVSQVCADAPPFFVVHGAYDSIIPVEIARAFVQRLSAVSREAVAYAELPMLQHGFDMVQSPATEFTIHAVRRFLAAQYRHYSTTDLPGESHERIRHRYS